VWRRLNDSQTVTEMLARHPLQRDSWPLMDQAASFTRANHSGKNRFLWNELPLEASSYQSTVAIQSISPFPEPNAWNWKRPHC
jgi:hypothetical protein